MFKDENKKTYINNNSTPIGIVKNFILKDIKYQMN